MEKKKTEFIRVIGHKNPDTDSVCSAIAYAYLKNTLGPDSYSPRRAGELNKETKFVLQHFGVKYPRLTADVSPQIKNLEIRREPGIDSEMSLRSAWRIMHDGDVSTLCITDDQKNLQGLITVTDIANANMDLFDTGVLSKSRTSYKNILETMKGTMLVGDPEGAVETGELRIGTSPEVILDYVQKGDIVLVTNRYEAQVCAIDCGASCIIVCVDARVTPGILERAKAAGCAVIQTEYDTYSAARLISMAAPVRHFMRQGDIVKFNMTTPVEDASRVMASLRHRYFPILDFGGKYCGMISRRNLLNVKKKKVILVDHNEKSQAVDGLQEAEILEIIDHHRIGNMETDGPVIFRNIPVGCTATIIYSMYRENDVEIPGDMAGLMLSAILSDTLKFSSPTCTDQDIRAAKKLAEIAGEDLDAYAAEMFDVGGDLTGESAEDIFYSDYKDFVFEDYSIAVGQGIFMSEKSVRQAEELVLPFIENLVRRSGEDMLFYMATNATTNDTLLLYAGENAQRLVSEAFQVEAENGKVCLPGVVSRKKQLIPPIHSALVKRSF